MRLVQEQLRDRLEKEYAYHGIKLSIRDGSKK